MASLIKVWAYARNVFEIVTRNAYQFMYNLALKHLNSLKSKAGIAFFDERIAYFEPKFNNYQTLFNAYQLNQASQGGNVLSFVDLLENLRTEKLDEWELATLNVYKKTSIEYKTIWNGGRAPYYIGSYSGRVLAVKTLSALLLNYPALAALQAEVAAFYLLLFDAQNTKDQSKTTTSTSNADIEPARLDCAKGMMVNLGLLIARCAEADNLIEVRNYFDVKAIQAHHQTDFDLTIKGLKQRLVCKRNMNPDDIIKITNTGTGAFKIAFVATKNAALPASALTVTNGQAIDKTAAELDYTATNLYLVIAGTAEGAVAKCTLYVP